MPNPTEGGDGLGTGPMRAKMVAVLAEFLDIPYERASEAMNLMWEATKEISNPGAAPVYQPDMSNPGHALAHRVQMAMTGEFDGEELFPVVVVCQARTGHIGMATTGIQFDEAEWLLRMGIGALRRTIRQHGSTPT